MAEFGWEWIAGALVVVFVLGFLFGRRREGRDLSAPPATPDPVRRRPASAKAFEMTRLDPSARAAIEQALESGQKIEAIKILRDSTSLGLKEAKEAVEAMER